MKRKEPNPNRAAQAATLYHMKQAAIRGDMDALAGHALVYLAILDQARIDT